MLNDYTDRPDMPQPYDIVTLKAGNAAGVSPATPLVIVELVEHSPGVLEVYRMKDDPAYQDWAAAITAADIEIITRYSGTGVRQWAPTPRT
ncbi:DUF6211 family protein [Streptomyces chryseus]|uniref:DUF6211 family protein n=1 Tax=Streptomyces chryseus TaxID=68186 RepID=UPI00110FADFF|nr:DUF6211 family protein [Streptomyces chryseus]GGX36416.1 hypothetical protein GCM10010353_59340 [Streptomyces chryseus]